MDQRFVALGTGAVLGLALVVGLAFARPFLGVTPDELAGPLETLPPPIEATDLARLFAGPGRATAAGESVLLSVTPAGRLVLPSGRLTIGDAFFIGPDSIVARRALPPGEHEVRMLEARGETYDSPAAALVSGSGSVRSWEPIPEASYAGVETSVVALAPAELDERFTEDPAAAETVIDRLVETYEATIGDAAPAWVDVEAVDGLRVYAVTTEFGVLAAYWGLDAEGEPVALLLDFGVIEPPDGG